MTYALPAKSRDAATAGASGIPLSIKFCGPVYGPSGYGELSRACVQALYDAELPVQVEAVHYETTGPALGEVGELLQRLELKTIPHNVKVLNLTPEQCLRFREPGCVNIAYTMFEADRIPKAWTEACNQLDGVIVPSTWCRDVFQASGVNVPVRVAPPGVDLGAFPLDRCEQDLVWLAETVRRQFDAGFRSVTRFVNDWLGIKRREQSGRPSEPVDLHRAFKFYSIFQWSERKNFRGLLESYFAEFHKETDVCLVLKSYGRDFSKAQGKWIRDQVEAIRRSISLPSYPPVLLITEMLSRREVTRLHAACDCFVLPHRAEGLGLPHLEAMAAGNPVITTEYSGNMEFTAPNNSFLVPYQLTPVFNMNWSPWYTGDMLWAEPDLEAFRGCMRQVYEDRTLARRVGRNARDFVAAEFSWKTRLKVLLTAIRDIVAESHA